MRVHMKPSAFFVLALVLGSALSAWMFILSAKGLVFLLMTPFGLYFLLTFLNGVLMPPAYHQARLFLPIPVTVLGIVLSIEVGMRLGLRTGLFWIAMAVIAWVLCLAGCRAGVRYRERYARFFSSE